jgi:pimeloyl-ACP methyl ester carboxylesterase
MLKNGIVALAALAAALTSGAAAAQSGPDHKPPMVIASQGNFFVGGGYRDDHPDRPWVGQMYVQYQIPAELRSPYPVVMVHGGSQTGQQWWQTPDGREGWAQFFLRRGFAVYVVDQVARGRSAYPYQFYPEMSSQSLPFILRRATGSEDGEHWLWPQAPLHTQGAGEPVPGDPVFDQNYMANVPSMDARQPQREMNIAALDALFDRIGEAVLMVHSQSGAYGWPVVQQRPNLVKALVAMEPSGPPVRDVVLTGNGPPDYFGDDDQAIPYGLAYTPIEYIPAISDPSELQFVKMEPKGPEFAGCWQQAEPARRLANMDQTPILVVGGEASFYRPYNYCTVRYLEQAGLHPDFYDLGDMGIHGNGHSMMEEKNSDEVAAVVADWIAAHVGSD